MPPSTLMPMVSAFLHRWVSPAMHRFASPAVPVAAPSDTLIVTCARNGTITPVDLYLQVQTVASPQITKVVNEDKENDDKDTYRVLFKFSGLQDAIRVISLCHNTQVKGLPLKAAFSPIRLN